MSKILEEIILLLFKSNICIFSKRKNKYINEILALLIHEIFISIESCSLFS